MSSSSENHASFLALFSGPILLTVTLLQNCIAELNAVSLHVDASLVFQWCDNYLGTARSHPSRSLALYTFAYYNTVRVCTVNAGRSSSPSDYREKMAAVKAAA